MKSILVIDSAGNREQYETDDIPRVGEPVMLEDGVGGRAAEPHYFRVRDVLHNLQGAPGRQVQILLDTETDMDWPS